jgi:hypothetical protein
MNEETYKEDLYEINKTLYEIKTTLQEHREWIDDLRKPSTPTTNAERLMIIGILAVCDTCELHDTDCTELECINAGFGFFTGDVICYEHIKEYSRYLVLQGVIRDCEECITVFEGSETYNPGCTECERFQEEKQAEEKKEK